MTDAAEPMTRLALPDGRLPVTDRDGVWAYSWDADAEHGSRAAVTRLTTGERRAFVDFDTARRWTHQVASATMTVQVRDRAAEAIVPGLPKIRMDHADPPGRFRVLRGETWEPVDMTWNPGTVMDWRPIGTTGWEIRSAGLGLPKSECLVRPSAGPFRIVHPVTWLDRARACMPDWRAMLSELPEDERAALIVEAGQVQTITALGIEAHILALVRELIRADWPDVIRVEFATSEWDNGYFFDHTTCEAWERDQADTFWIRFDDSGKLDELNEAMTDYVGDIGQVGRLSRLEVDLINGTVVTDGR